MILAEDLLPIGEDVEHASVAAVEGAVDLVTEAGLQLDHQTGGVGQVVSAHAVVDVEVHRRQR